MDVSTFHESDRVAILCSVTSTTLEHSNSELMFMMIWNSQDTQFFDQLTAANRLEIRFQVIDYKYRISIKFRITIQYRINSLILRIDDHDVEPLLDANLSHSQFLMKFLLWSNAPRPDAGYNETWRRTDY
ncbi:hypothetical protein EVAR_102117_1 [Eumeta japonica]|uniref:Uncharacterized protein n=1 Tax=Eumeta variegata TaxID=151549 RepID=A0A4C1TZU9_EUMVA|nr:hypothetical protein EVAR_102117_1 [Eumeta japonica]